MGTKRILAEKDLYRGREEIQTWKKVCTVNMEIINAGLKDILLCEAKLHDIIESWSVEKYNVPFVEGLYLAETSFNPGGFSSYSYFYLSGGSSSFILYETHDEWCPTINLSIDNHNPQMRCIITTDAQGKWIDMMIGGIRDGDTYVVNNFVTLYKCWS